MIRENLKVAHSQQKSYAAKRGRDLSFEISDFIYLKVSPMGGTRRFKVKRKLAPRYVSPFKIISRKRRSSLSTGITASAIRRTRRIPRVVAQEVFVSPRGTTPNSRT
jgi:hypothetical protein